MDTLKYPSPILIFHNVNLKKGFKGVARTASEIKFINQHILKGHDFGQKFFFNFNVYHA